MGAYPDYRTYRALYARYVNRGVGRLLDLLQPLAGMRLLDLCAGEGLLSLGALERGALHATMVERERAMVPYSMHTRPGISVVVDFVEAAHARDELRGGFERAACRQAINYWLRDERSVRNLAQRIVPGGIFAFNTFNREPPTKPRTLEYHLDGHDFVEVSWSVDGVVHHLQARDGMEPHHTSFRWLPPDRIRACLEPHFSVTEERDDGSSYYRCVRK